MACQGRCAADLWAKASSRCRSRRRNWPRVTSTQKSTSSSMNRSRLDVQSANIYVKTAALFMASLALHLLSACAPRVPAQQLADLGFASAGSQTTCVLQNSVVACYGQATGAGATANAFSPL